MMYLPDASRYTSLLIEWSRIFWWLNSGDYPCWATSLSPELVIKKVPPGLMWAEWCGLLLMKAVRRITHDWWQKKVLISEENTRTNRNNVDMLLLISSNSNNRKINDLAVLCVLFMLTSSGFKTVHFFKRCSEKPADIRRFFSEVNWWNKCGWIVVTKICICIKVYLSVLLFESFISCKY